MIGIYNSEELIGVLLLYSQFDDIVNKLKIYKYDTVVVLNAEDSKEIYQNNSYSKKFIDKYYVVNSNSEPYLERLMKQSGIDSLYEKWDKHFIRIKSNEHLISKYSISDINEVNKAQVFIFKSLDELDFDDINLIQNWYIVFTLIIILFSIFIVYYLYASYIIGNTSKENSTLLIINENLKEKTDQLDYNEKKIENLFNSQPNLMIMHNGFEVTEANKRFMGFFNRFGTFDGFKKNHKCVSELFEEYDAPNYIWEQYIDDTFWIDYILENPRKLYKVVMSIENRQGVQEAHHFIIKFNEIKYAGIVSERLIIVAFVDMTQDMVNYKSLEELSIKKEDNK